VGQGVGNLKALAELRIYLNNSNNDVPDWEILARILTYIQNKVELRIIGGHKVGTEDMRAFAPAIQGHPTITSIVTEEFSFESIASLCSSLTTLPNLEYVLLGSRQLGEDEGVPHFQFLETMTAFLRAPSLRVVTFREFCFTGPLCQATAKALRQGSSITSLVLDQCYFLEGGNEQIASALKENARLLKSRHFFRWYEWYPRSTLRRNGCVSAIQFNFTGPYNHVSRRIRSPHHWLPFVLTLGFGDEQDVKEATGYVYCLQLGGC
jgi:hypothetical protein